MAKGLRVMLLSMMIDLAVSRVVFLLSGFFPWLRFGCGISFWNFVLVGILSSSGNFFPLLVPSG